MDVRVLAATNRVLPAKGAAGRFREDLYFRLSVIPLEVPPLRERPDDIPLLAVHFLRRYAIDNDLPVRTLSPGALALLGAMRWRGNVRELGNVVRGLVDREKLGPALKLRPDEAIVLAQTVGCLKP